MTRRRRERGTLFEARRRASEHVPTAAGCHDVLRLHTSWAKSIPTIIVAGEIDVATVAQLDEAVAMATFIAGDVVVDLDDVTFLDLRGLERLAAAARDVEHRGHRLTVLHPPDSYLRMARELPSLVTSIDADAATRSDGDTQHS